MKVLLLADAMSPHIIKWAKGLSLKNIEVGIFTLSKYDGMIYKGNEKIRVFDYSFNQALIQSGNANLQKIKYLLVVNSLKKVILDFSPQILHAHYASSYGLIGALSSFHPYIISVWGTDVYGFPKKSIIHKWLLKFNLSKADKILSTSYAMANETNLYTNKIIEITPFGIDLDKFKPNISNALFPKESIVIGTVKKLEEQYGIKYLIEAFSLIKNRHENLPLYLLIVGGGTQEKYLKNLARYSNVEKDTIFTGDVPYESVVEFHNMLSISVVSSISESFGVSVIEASACEKPVIVSNTGGLPEVVEDGVTGFLIPSQNVQVLAETIERLVLDGGLRRKMGKAGRKRVTQLFNWNDNLNKMVNIYNNVIDKRELQ